MKSGDIYLDKNELDEALNHYKKAANIKTTNSFKASYLLNIAKIYKLIYNKNRVGEVPIIGLITHMNFIT